MYNIIEYGAIPDGVTNNASAIQQAVDEAAVTGGTVIVPPGTFLSGTVRLRSDVELHLSKGAVLISSLRKEDILQFAVLFEDDNADTGWDGGCFLFAKDEKNITISGQGMIYGQGDKVFFEDGADGGIGECPLNVAEFRPRTTFFENVHNLVIKDITIQDAAFWTLHMAGCQRVRVQDVTILNNIRGANNDGIDPDCCKDVIITGCYVESGDDAIVVKTTKPMAEKYGCCENIVISNCILSSHDSALKIGTETHGDIRNILLSDCIIKDCSRGIGIWARDGATIEEIHIHHLTGSVRKYADAAREKGPAMWWGNGEPLFINATYRNKNHTCPGKIQNITFDHIYMKAESSMFFGGEEKAVLKNIKVTDCKIIMCRQGSQKPGFFDEQPSLRHVYPHHIPAVYARWVDGLDIEGTVKFIEPYSNKENGSYESENCTKEQIRLKED